MTRLTFLVFLTAFANPIHAQVTMQWKLAPGDAFRFEAVEKQTQKVTTAGKTTELRNTITTVLATHVQKTTADGAIAELKIESVKIDTTQPGGTDGEIARLIGGAAFTVTLTPQGQITSFAGYDEFIKKLTQDRKLSERLLRSIVSEESLQRSLADYFAFLPPMPVNKGDCWQREGYIPLGPLGHFSTLNKHVYEGKRGAAELIAYTATLTYEPPQNGSGLFKLVKGDLQAKSASGSFQFDVDKGRLLQADKRLTLGGDLTIDVAGNQVEMSIEMEQTTAIRLLRAE